VIAIAPSAFAAHHEVTITTAPGSSTPGCEETNSCFIPNPVTVDLGTIVTWSNTDTAAHTASSGTAAGGDMGEVWDSSLIMAGGSFSYTTDTVGSFDYFCMVHPWMAGTLIVEAAGAADAAAADAAATTTSEVSQASGGCGTGTVLVDGVCQLAPQESNDGCGAGTVMVNGVCQLDKSSGSSIPPLYIAGGAAAIGAAIIGIIFAVRRGSSGTSTPKPARQDLDDYEDQYLRRQGQRPTRKPAETRPTSSSCNSCGKPLKPTAKFCGKCGSKQ